MEARHYSNYSYPGDDMSNVEHVGHNRFYGSSSANDTTFATCANSNANTNDDVVGSILDSIDHMESQMDPVCDDSRRFSGHVPVTGSANQWRHRRGWGRAESHGDEPRLQQHYDSDGGAISQQNQHVIQHGHQHANSSYDDNISWSSGHNEQQQQHILPQYHQTQQATLKNPYRSKGSTLHTVANLMLLFSGFTIALTLLERFCVDWLANGLAWW